MKPMTRCWRLCGMTLFTVAMCAWSPGERAAFAQWGHVEGLFVFDGDVPQLPLLVKQGDASVKDAAICSADPVPDESLVVNSKNKGVANVFVFLRKADKVHPDLKVSKEKEIRFDQKNCRFLPHALIVRTDQVFVCLSDDGVPHNTHTFPQRNNGENMVIQPKDRKGTAVRLKAAEAAPFDVKCDIHSWMSSKWLVIDHPYGAVTDADGKFKIEKLPVGQHKFRVWHERAGLIEREWAVDVKEGANTIAPVKLTAEKLKPKT